MLVGGAKGIHPGLLRNSLGGGGFKGSGREFVAGPNRARADGDNPELSEHSTNAMFLRKY